MTPVKALFRGRHRKLKYIAAIAFLLAGCVGTLGLLTFTSMTSTAEYKVSGLKVQQNGTGLDVTWDDQESDGYEVFLQCNGQRPQVFTVEENHCRIELNALAKEYKVTVTAKSEEGGVSGATSEVVKTEKVEQIIETSKEAYAGLEGNASEVAAESETDGAITYQSSNPAVVAVDEDGTLQYGEAGHAEVSISAEEDDQYKAAEKTVEITVYPEKLTVPVMKQDKKKTDSYTAKLTWEPVEFAQGYRLLRYDPAKKKYKEYEEYKADETSAKIPRDHAKYVLEAFAKVEGNEVGSDQSKPVEVKSAADEAEARGSAHNIRTLDFSNLETVVSISGEGAASVPQSMSHVGDNYVVTYVDHGGTVGALVTYSKDGERLGTSSISGMGHANGSTYNPNTGKIYTVRTHRAIRSSECSTYDPKDGSKEDTFNLPKVTSGIAYDETCNKYYLSKGNEIYVTSDDFEVEKFIWKRIRYNHAQDIGAHNGVAMVCTWVAGNESYIDLYRTSDGAYLGSYYVPIGEIESCFIDDKHLIILMNNATRSGDCILRTKDPVVLP